MLHLLHRRLGLVAAVGAAASVSAAVVLLAGARLASAEVTPAPVAPACAPPAAGSSAASARRVADAFIRTAVLRRRTECSYDLVTADFRQGMTRREWATGEIPVQPFLTRWPDRLATQRVAGVTTSAERSAWIVLEAADADAAVFEIVVVLRGGRWLVDYWAPAVASAVPAAF